MKLEGNLDEKAAVAKNVRLASPPVGSDTDSSPPRTSVSARHPRGYIRIGSEDTADDAAANFAKLEQRLDGLELFASRSSTITDDIRVELDACRSSRVE